ncbi:DUF397 domain-containing protein [Streptomyces sp. NPDC003717]|uniref:DUF397 domain-containing protein n=1 Tax=Streptomyces sp. NPDC003717 TaxID=3154276 RepID=UPI0033A80D9D
MNTDLRWFKSTYSGTEGGDCLEVALEWTKSSYSGTEGGNCLEVALGWKKSSYSNSQGGDCLEVALCGCRSAHPRAIHVRDSKLGARSPRFAVDEGAWGAFVAHARTGA